MKDILITVAELSILGTWINFADSYMFDNQDRITKVEAYQRMTSGVAYLVCLVTKNTKDTNIRSGHKNLLKVGFSRETLPYFSEVTKELIDFYYFVKNKEHDNKDHEIDKIVVLFLSCLKINSSIRMGRLDTEGLYTKNRDKYFKTLEQFGNNLLCNIGEFCENYGEIIEILTRIFNCGL